MSSSKSTTEYWKERETVEILSGKRERQPSKKQIEAIQEDEGTAPPSNNKQKKVNKDAIPKLTNSTKKKKANSTPQNVAAAVRGGEREVETEVAIVDASMRQEKLDVGERVAETGSASEEFVMESVPNSDPNIESM